jgi:small subunit ribosomal protein S20
LRAASIFPASGEPVRHDPTFLEAVLPNIKSAEKRMRTQRVREERNRQKRSRLRTALKKVRLAESAEVAESAYADAKSLLDRAAAKRLIHPNKAARLKSQLANVVKTKA